MPSNQITSLSVRIHSTPFEVRSALEKIRTALDPLELDSEETGTVEIVLAEALNNIVEHAYAESDQGRISIRCHFAADGLHVRIKDHGNAMPNGMLPSDTPIDIPTEEDELPEGGFGWFLIQNLADEVQYIRKDGENQLNLRLAVGLSPSTSH